MASIDSVLDRPPLLPEAESSLPAAFDRAAAAYGSRVALVSDVWCPTYDELNATANRLAHRLITRDGVPGERVAILMHHDAPAVAAVLGVLKAGCIAVPMNSTHPPLRLRQIIACTSPTLIIADAEHRDLAAEIGGPHCTIVVFPQYGMDGPVHAPVIETAPDNVAVLITTSGSTGIVKAVMGTHRHLLRNSIVLSEAMAFSAVDRIPLLGSIDGSQGLAVMLCSLFCGASLYPFPVMVRGVTGLANWIEEQKINTYVSSASVFRNFMNTLGRDFKFENVRVVRLASESAAGDDVRLFRQHFTDSCMLVHALASSETGNVSWTRYSYNDAIPDGRLAVGAPSRGHQLLIVDDNERRVLPGEIGEIVIRSNYIARGYWGASEATAASFSGALDGGGVRQFRTGDMGRINAAGLLEFCGRRDSRVKIRGNRIELTQVESAVQQLSGIDHAVVEAITSPGHEPRLVAFVTQSSEQAWSHTKLRGALRLEFPDYMVPSRFVVLDRFPLTPTGKIDRQRLKQDHANWPELVHAMPPSTATEVALAGIWAKVFDCEDIGRDTDFFELGGDSLTAAVVAVHVHAAFGVDLNLGQFADHPTLSALGAVIDESGQTGKLPGFDLVPVSRAQPLPLSWFQERAWINSQTPEGLSAYINIDRYRMEGNLDIRAFRQCLDDLVSRHEGLRTTFAVRDDRPVQIVHRPQQASFEFVDLTGSANPQLATDVLSRKLAARKIDLGKLPLLHFTLAKIAPTTYWLLRHRHHIISDAWSSEMYFRELAQLYSARVRGGAPPLLDARKLDYADFAAWQRKTLDPSQAAYRHAAAWWKGVFADSPEATDFPFKYRRSVQRWLKRVTVRDPADGIIRWGIDQQITERLQKLGRAERASFNDVRLAAFVALLADECKVDDVIIYTYVSVRNRLPLQTMYGPFVNVVPLRFRCEPTMRFRAWLDIVRKRALEFSEHSEIPIEYLREALKREGVRLPSFHLIFNVNAHPTINLSGLQLSWSDQQILTMPWGFTMAPDRLSEDRNCRTLFDARSYESVEVRRVVKRYQCLLDAISRNADLSIEELLMVSRQRQ